MAEVCTGGLESPIDEGGALATFLAFGLADLAAWSALIASTPLTSVAATKSPFGRDFRMSAY